MRKKQSKNSRKNIDRIWKMWRNKSAKKGRSNEENYQGGLWQRSCMDGQTSNMTRNIGEGWKEIGDDGRAKDQQEER